MRARITKPNSEANRLRGKNGRANVPAPSRLRIRTVTKKKSPPVKPPTVKTYYASIYPGKDRPVPRDFAADILRLEKLLGLPVWLLVQNGSGPWAEISGPLFKGFQKARAGIQSGKPAALLIESPGGDPDFAYRIARMMQRCTGNNLPVVVPQYAKSAATLIALAGKELILSRDAELGPLDVQIFDLDREDYGSALNAVQSIERLNAVAMTAVDQTMMLLARRTGKRIDVLLPHILNYVAMFLRPLLDKIDTVDYTKKSRDLKLTEEYAVRLMRPNYQFTNARRIARQLVEKYPTHGFMIDHAEACTYAPVSAIGETFGLGLKVSMGRPQMNEIEDLLEGLVPHLDTLSVAGRIQQVSP